MLLKKLKFVIISSPFTLQEGDSTTHMKPNRKLSSSVSLCHCASVLNFCLNNG